MSRRSVPRETVAEALGRRGGCRYGLAGVRMRHEPTGRAFVCGGSMWDQEGNLRLLTRPSQFRPGYEPVGKIGATPIHGIVGFMNGLVPYHPDEILRAEDGRWSSGALLYQARDRVSLLESPRDGKRVDDLSFPVREGGRKVVHWYIVGAEATF